MLSILDYRLSDEEQDHLLGLSNFVNEGIESASGEASDSTPDQRREMIKKEMIEPVYQLGVPPWFVVHRLKYHAINTDIPRGTRTIMVLTIEAERKQVTQSYREAVERH
jgi:hypothetical protein